MQPHPRTLLWCALVLGACQPLAKPPNTQTPVAGSDDSGGSVITADDTAEPGPGANSPSGAGSSGTPGAAGGPGTGGDAVAPQGSQGNVNGDHTGVNDLPQDAR